MFLKTLIFLVLMPTVFGQTAFNAIPSLIAKVGPISLNFSSKAIQENSISFEIPDQFLPKLMIKWSVKVITTKDETSTKENCPKAGALISVRKANRSSNSMKTQEGALTKPFWITSNGKHVIMNVEIQGNSTNKHYIASILTGEAINTNEMNTRHIPGHCVYLAQGFIFGYKKTLAQKNGFISDKAALGFLRGKDHNPIAVRLVRNNEPVLRRARRSLRSGRPISLHKRDIPVSRQLLYTLPLSLSNIIFFPCGILAIIKRHYSESVLYFLLMISSAFYHACDNHYQIKFCIMPYETLQFCDFFCALAAMWVTLIAMAKLPFRLESLFHVSGIMVIGIGVTYNRFSVITGLIPIASGLLILAFKCGNEIRKARECYPPKRDWLCSIIPGALCSIGGFISFGLSNSSNYVFLHSLWHLLMGCTILFLLPKQKKFSWHHRKDRLPRAQCQPGSPDYQDLLSDTTAVDMDSLLDQHEA